MYININLFCCSRFKCIVSLLDDGVGSPISANNLNLSSSEVTKRRVCDISENNTVNMSLTVCKPKRKRKKLTSKDIPVQDVEPPQPFVLYSFPSYDKSDSAIYFPSTFTRLFNGGDFDQLYKLFSSHMDMNCDMNVTYMNMKPNTQNLSELYAFFMDLFPDMFMCVDSVTVEENQIRAVIYRKYTDVKAIKEGLLRSVKTPMQYAILQTFLQRERFLSYGLSKKEKKELKAILKQETDLEVFLRMQMILTLDHNGKFVSLVIIPGLDSITPVLL